jgi:flagellar hook-basal body protein
MRSLSSAVAGLRTHQTKMDVIGNNIANVNTFGFKSSRATFSDVYYQNLAGSKAGMAQQTGGRNPTQIGYGASVATIDVMMNVSGSATTDRALDVHITGEGFLVTKDVAGRTFYSRLGNMGFDAAGNLVDGNGYLVQGFPMQADPDNPGFFVPQVPATGIADPASLRGIWCDPALMERMTGIAVSATGQITGLLAGEQEIVYTGAEDWIKDLNLPSTSSYSGTVTWNVSAMYNTDEITTALGLKDEKANAVTEVVMGNMALPKTFYNEVTKAYEPVMYSLNKNGNTVEIKINGPTPTVTLVGTLSNNQLVFKNGNTIAFTVKFDPLKEVKLADIIPAGTNDPVMKLTENKTTLMSALTDEDATWQQVTQDNLDKYPTAFKPKTPAAVVTAYLADPGLDLTFTNVDKVKELYELDLLVYDPDAAEAPEDTNFWTTDPFPGTFTLKTDDDLQQAIADALLGPGWEDALANQEAKVEADFTVAELQALVIANVPDYDAEGSAVMEQDGDKTIFVPAEIPLEMYEQIRTTDKGGNTIIMGRTGGEPIQNPYNTDGTVTGYPTVWTPPTTANPVLEYGDISFSLGNTSNMATLGVGGDVDTFLLANGYSSVMANAKAEEETAFIIGQLVLGKFQNAAGLLEAGTSIFQATNNSGEPILVVPGLEGTGATQAGKLEMSNVDISKEFTDMITTQRGFQANTRIVTVSDEMLQELVNLKR